MLKMHQIHKSVHTFYIYLEITHTERNYATVMSADNKIVPSVCTATQTLCGFLLMRWLGLTSARMTVHTSLE